MPWISLMSYLRFSQKEDIIRRIMWGQRKVPFPPTPVKVSERKDSPLVSPCKPVTYILLDQRWWLRTWETTLSHVFTHQYTHMRTANCIPWWRLWTLVMSLDGRASSGAHLEVKWLPGNVHLVIEKCWRGGDLQGPSEMSSTKCCPVWEPAIVE